LGKGIYTKFFTPSLKGSTRPLVIECEKASEKLSCTLIGFVIGMKNLASSQHLFVVGAENE
jgi:hypothetical protein